MEPITLIGGGIVGAAIAEALSRAGAEVTVIEAAPAATPASFGWINASFYHDEAHHGLRAEGLAAWRALGLPDDALRWCGALSWEADAETLEAQAAALEAMGYPVGRLSGRDLSARVPGLAQAPDAALEFPSEGAADPVRVTRELRRRAVARGARWIAGLRIEALETSGGAIAGLSHAGGVLPARRVVLAAGCGTPALLSPLGIALPMPPRPGLMLVSRPVAPLAPEVLVTPLGEVRQDADGRLHMPAAVSHQSDESRHPPSDPWAEGTRAMARLRDMIPGHAPQLERVRLGWRPVPGDGLPVIGPTPVEGLHVAVMHSGVTLAAIAARIVAGQLSGAPGPGDAELAAPYGIGRFAAR